jgi:hypothetical protein
VSKQQTDIAKDWLATAIRQAEFLNKLSALMNEYQAEFKAESVCHGYGNTKEFISIEACGHWIPWHEEHTYFDVDRCIEATKATIEHAKALEQ